MQITHKAFFYNDYVYTAPLGSISPTSVKLTDG